ncbi:MAG: hypothetical protein J5715_02240 [Clostridiales bacterium]|nr:hypothetical protein [Clostridiales bacterium]
MKLAGIFGDRMILQRNKENHIWGWDDSPAVTVTIDGEKFSAECVDGRFNIVIKPMDTRLDVDIVVEGSETLVLRDCCFGDVFMLAGQSNMELPVYRTLDISQEIVDKADYPYIRQYRLVPDNDYKPLDEYKLSSDPWISAVPGEIDEMSAYGFFTFRHIYEKTGVPVGLILNAQGGATIEAWMREEDLDEELELIDENYGEGYLPKKVAAQYEEGNKWRERTEIFDINEYASKIPADTTDVEVPCIFRDITGSSWFYKEFEVEGDCENAFLYLGELIDADRTFINGVEVGRTEYMYPPRKYPFDAKILRKGKNLIAVRLISESESAGFISDHPYYIEMDGVKTDLTGTWKMIPECRCGINPVVRMAVMYPVVLYNSAIQTLRGIAVKAFFWYQGESNGEKYIGYDLKFKRMVDSWREIFGKDVPIVATIMPDYINPQSDDISEVPFGWREIQRQQEEAPSMVADCYTVEGRDLGQPFELHPQCKVELGDRAAKVFMEVLGIDG